MRRSLAPLVGGPQAIAADIVPGVALGYFSTRLEQALSGQVDFDVPAAMQALGSRAEAYYLPQYLTAIRLDDVPSVLAVERRLAKLMASR